MDTLSPASSSPTAPPDPLVPSPSDPAGSSLTDITLTDPTDLLETMGEDDVFEVDLSGDDATDSQEDFDALMNAPFDADLSTFLSESVLHRISCDLMEGVEADLASRSEWEQTYADGIRLLGIREEIRTDPWEGACALTHPMLIESVVRFQSETVMETLPASGPVKVNIVGMETPQKLDAARRVAEDMNWQLMEQMPEYRTEHERLLWSLPIAGSAFKKVYFDPTLGRQVSVFVPAEDVIIPHGATDLAATCPRLAHRMKKHPGEVAKLVRAGFYRDVDLSGPSPEREEVSEAVDEEIGHTPPSDDERLTLMEIHTEFDLLEYMDYDPRGADDGDEGLAQGVGGMFPDEMGQSGAREEPGRILPYVVTVEKTSGKVMSLRRNWNEPDPLALARQHFVHYQYVPGFGAYGFGLIHLIGNYARGATAILRQLGDAGTLANLPGGFKTRTMRVKNDNEPISPGEFRDVDVEGKIEDHIMPLPYKEPSQTLAALMNVIVEDGRRLAGMADLKISDMSGQTPVGTILAVLERMLKVMSAVQARVHYAMKKELRLLRDIIRDTAAREYAYDVQAQQGRSARASDYTMVEIYPVSDPNASTMSQRIIQYQTVQQLAQSAPQLYNMQELHRQMLGVLGVQDVGRLIPTPDDMQPVDPVSENMAMLTLKPVKAFIHQDHEAHITAHMAAMQDPSIAKMVGQNPNAQAMQAAMMAHICEHLGFLYRAQIEQMMGAPLPPPGQPLPQEVEVQLSRLVAQAAQKLLGRNIATEQAQAAQQAMQDPVLQQAMREIEIKDKDTNRKILKDLADASLAAEKIDLEREIMVNKAASDGMRAGAQARKVDAEGDLDRARFAADNMQALVRMYMEQANIEEDRRERMQRPNPPRES